MMFITVEERWHREAVEGQAQRRECDRQLRGTPTAARMQLPLSLTIAAHTHLEGGAPLGHGLEERELGVEHLPADDLCIQRRRLLIGRLARERRREVGGLHISRMMTGRQPIREGNNRHTGRHVLLQICRAAAAPSLVRHALRPKPFQPPRTEYHSRVTPPASTPSSPVNTTLQRRSTREAV